MYEAFYRLSSDPFRLLPDANICFLHRSCSRAWAYMRYALERGEGIVVVTGPPGSGKTTLAQHFMSELNPATVVGIRIVADDPQPDDLLLASPPNDYTVTFTAYYWSDPGRIVELPAADAAEERQVDIYGLTMSSRLVAVAGNAGAWLLECRMPAVKAGFVAQACRDWQTAVRAQLR